MVRDFRCGWDSPVRVKEKTPLKFCKWCTAEEGEKRFVHCFKDTCDSCARMRYRDKCERCDGPKCKRRCERCDPPPKNKVGIILVDPKDNERLIYRSIQCRTANGPKFPFNGGLITKEEPVVITVSREEFLKILC